MFFLHRLLPVDGGAHDPIDQLPYLYLKRVVDNLRHQVLLDQSLAFFVPLQFELGHGI